jgi:hypothetical protein
MAATRISPWQLAAVRTLAWLAFGPPTPDLAAQVYRSGCVARTAVRADHAGAVAVGAAFDPRRIARATPAVRAQARGPGAEL